MVSAGLLKRTYHHKIETDQMPQSPNYGNIFESKKTSNIRNALPNDIEMDEGSNLMLRDIEGQKQVTKRKYKRKINVRKKRKPQKKFPKWSSEVESIDDIRHTHFSQYMDESIEISLQELLDKQVTNTDNEISPNSSGSDLVVDDSPYSPSKFITPTKNNANPNGYSPIRYDEDVSRQLFAWLPKQETPKTPKTPTDTVPMTPEVFFEKLRLSPSPSPKIVSNSCNIVHYVGIQTKEKVEPNSLKEKKAVRSLFLLSRQGEQQRKKVNKEEKLVSDVFKAWAESDCIIEE